MMELGLSIFIWIVYLVSLYFTIFWLLVFLDHRKSFKEENNMKDRALKDYPFVSVLIPAYNEESSLRGSVDSVMALDYPKDRFELIMINDGSKDNTKEVAREAISDYNGRNIHLIDQKNHGKAAAMNNGLKKAKGKYFACLDADSFVEKATLKKMVYLFENSDNPHLAIVTPAMKVKNPKNLLQRMQWFEYIVSLFIARLMSKIDCIYVAPGPFSLYRKDTIVKLEGFDTTSITEDQEIAYRVQKHHYAIKQCHDAYVHTIAPSKTKELYKQRNRWYKGSMINILKYKKLFWNKSYGDFGMLQMTVNLFIFIFSICALFLAGYFILKPIYEHIYNLALVGFDIWPYIRSFDWSMNLLFIDIGKTLILYLLLATGLFFLIVAHKNATERLRKRSILYFIPYFFIYYLVLAFIAVRVLFELIIGKRQKW